MPWTLRNVRVYDRFVLIASEGGVTFWTGNHPLAVGDGDLAANPEIKQAELAFRRGASRPDARSAGAALLPRRSRATSPRTPAGGSSLLARKAFYTRRCRSDRPMRYTRPGIGPRRSVPYLLLLPFAVARSPAPRGARQQPPARSVPAGRLRRARRVSCFFRRSDSGFP